MIKPHKILAAALCLAVLAGCGGSPASSGDSSVSAGSTPAPETQPIIQAKAQTEVWPLTGLELPDEVAQAPRPVAVLVDNTAEAYPQWGVSGAQVIVEAVTEGGVTRLLCLYNNTASVPKTGPVRSVRDLFLQLCMPLNAVPVHIGTSTFAENFLNYYQWTTVDGLNVGVNTFDFDKDRALVRTADGKRIGREHCWYTHGEAVANGMTMRGISPDGEMHMLFDFAADAKPAGQPATQIQLQYSYVAQSGFSYDAASGKYLKTSYGGQPHVDANNNQQLAFDNVVLLRCESYLKPDGVHTDFNLSGGKGWWISGGQMQPITWEKGDPEKPLVLRDQEGKVLSVKAGTSYIGMLSGTAGESLTVEGAAMLDGSPVDPPVPSPTATPAPTASPTPAPTATPEATAVPESAPAAPAA